VTRERLHHPATFRCQPEADLDPLNLLPDKRPDATDSFDLAEFNRRD
jgi:hypothetical protein